MPTTKAAETADCVLSHPDEDAATTRMAVDALKHRLLVSGYSALAMNGGAWDNRRCCNAIIGRTAPHDRPCPMAAHWYAAAAIVRRLSDDGFAPVPALEAMIATQGTELESEAHDA